MDAGEGWSELNDYSLFLPDDTFNLFGECDLNFDFNDFLDPAVGEANNILDPIGWDRQQRLVAVQPDLSFQLSTLEEPNDLSPNPEEALLASNHAPACSLSSDQDPRSENQISQNSFLSTGTEHEHQLKIVSSKRKFLAAFSVISGENVRLRNRKPFSEERKKEVALNRTIGVCLHCRLKKVAVSPVEFHSSGEG
jgi:hypothetical protein